MVFLWFSTLLNLSSWSLFQYINWSAPTGCCWAACNWASGSFQGEPVVDATPPRTGCVWLAVAVESRRCEPACCSSPTAPAGLPAGGDAALPAPTFPVPVVGPHLPSGPQMVKWPSRPTRLKQTEPAEMRLKIRTTKSLFLCEIPSVCGVFTDQPIPTYLSCNFCKILLRGHVSDLNFSFIHFICSCFISCPLSLSLFYLLFFFL